jgi:hypothetical protein
VGRWNFENLSRTGSVVDQPRARYRHACLNYSVDWGMTLINLGNKCRVGLLPLLVSVAAACSDMAPDGDTYNTTIRGLNPGGSSNEPSGDSGSGGGSGGTEGDRPEVLPPEWACLDEPMMPVARDPARVQYRVAIVDFDSQPIMVTPVAGVQVSVCSNAACDPPMPTCPEGVELTPTQQCVTVTNIQGPVYQMNLPFNFQNGSLKLTAPGYAEMNYIFGGPMIGAPEGGPLVLGLAIPLLRESARVSAYLDCNGTQVNADRGTLAVRTLDCKRNRSNLDMVVLEGSRAPNVSVEPFDGEPTNGCAWTLSNDNSFSPNSLRTDGRGVAGYLDTDVGLLRLVAESPVNVQYPAAPPNLRVRPNVITLAELRDGLGRWGQ